LEIILLRKTLPQEATEGPKRDSDTRLVGLSVHHSIFVQLLSEFIREAEIPISKLLIDR
jgi:hypothetical protein